eukprot:1187261-Prorocentrum_minimum.AAC.2
MKIRSTSARVSDKTLSRCAGAAGERAAAPDPPPPADVRALHRGGRGVLGGPRLAPHVPPRALAGGAAQGAPAEFRSAGAGGVGARASRPRALILFWKTIINE